jgi:Transposase DDE domain
VACSRAGRLSQTASLLSKFRRTKGAVTLHCLLDHNGYLPSVVVITEGKRHDVRVARTLRFEAGTVVVMDRGYVDYAWFGQLTALADLVQYPQEIARSTGGIPANLDSSEEHYYRSRPTHAMVAGVN